MQATSEQETILGASLTKSNLIIKALAGTGKTTTIEMVEKVVKEKPSLYLCFNKKVAEVATKRVQTTTTVRTFNSIGHRIWSGTQNKNLTLNPKKTQDIFREVINEIPKKNQEQIWEAYWEVVQGVGVAKTVGYLPEGKFPAGKRICSQASFHKALDEEPDDLVADLIDVVLTRSILAAYKGLIDYNDQVYMPAVFGGKFPQFPIVFIDEAQDLNAVNHLMLERLITRRTIIVGDEFQSIYGFRGAVQEGMAKLAQVHKAEPFTLSVSFRCPQAIVENARWRVPHFKWIKEGGHVESLTEATPANFTDGCTIICRNNAPLFRLAMQLLSTGRSVSVAGSDIGPKLVGIMRKLGSEETSKEETLGAIADWEARKLDRGSTTARDLAACMRVFASHGSDLGQAIRYAEHLFAQTGSIRLMTGHKAKGLEFPVVYHLDSFLCRDTEQDMNLRYVIDTRAQERLYYIDSENIRWQ